MADNEIFAQLAQYNFTPVNQNICVGTWNNYAVTLQRFSGRSYYVYLAIRVQKAELKPLKKALAAAVKASGVRKAGVNRVLPNFIHTYFNFDKTGDLQSFNAFLETLTGALMQNGARPADTCAVTGAANPDSLCLLGAPNCFGYQPVCAAAIRQNDYEVQAKAEENENNGSYLTGFIGALIGALVGIGVNVLSILFLERIFALLFALVPICAMFGYKLFKGKTDKLSMVIVIVLSVLAVPVMEFLAIAFSFVKDAGAPVGEAISLTKDIFFESYVLKETGPEMGKFLLFMALGVFFAWSYMRNQLNSTKAQGAKLQLDTLRPNPNYQMQQQAYAAPQETAAVPEQAYEFSQPSFEAPEQAFEMPEQADEAPQQ